MKRASGLAALMVTIALITGACSSKEPVGRPASSAMQVDDPVKSDTQVTQKESPEPTQQQTSVEASLAVRAKPAKQTHPELEFQPVIWMLGSPIRPSGSGVWVYTKAQHPGNITSIDWDKNDLVLVQLPGDQFKGYDMRLQAVQDLGADVVRLVCKIEPPRPEVKSDMDRKPAAWFVVPAGSLQNKRFVVADQELNELPTD